MLDPNLLAVAARRIELDMQDRRDAFFREVRDLKGRLAGRGLLTSGIAQKDIEDAIAAEMRVRAAMIWQTLSRVLSGENLDLDPAIAAQIKAFVRTALSDHSEDLTKERDFANSLMGGPDHVHSIVELQERAYNRVASEVDLALLDARKRTTTTKRTTVNIYQPIGIVQTGDHSSATFYHGIADDERKALDRALAAVEKAVSESQVKSAANEIIADAKHEIAKSEPNIPRLQGSLSALATTIQTLGSAAAAYQLLKGAAALVGVTLP